MSIEQKKLSTLLKKIKLTLQVNALLSSEL